MPLAIYQFPDWAIFALLSGIVVVILVFGPLLVRRLPFVSASTVRGDAAMDSLKLIGALIVLFSSFLLLQTVNRFHSSEALVVVEAGAVMHLNRSLMAPPISEAREARRALRDYVAATIDDEWPAMRRGTTSPKTAAQFAVLIERIRVIDLEMGGDNTSRQQLSAIDDDFDNLEDVRNQRLSVAETGLPELFWAVLGGLMVLFFIEALMTQHDWGEVVPRLGYGIALALLLALLVIYDRPFVGDQSIDSEPLQRALLILDQHLGVAPAG